MKVVRKGFQEEVISASGVEGSRSVRKGHQRVWEVTAGSMWPKRKRKMQEVARAGVAESPGVSLHRALTAVMKILNSALRTVGKQGWFLLVEGDH